MGRPRLDALPGYDPRIVKRRPSDVGDMRNSSKGGIAHTPEILNRPYNQDFNERNREADTYNDKLIERDRGLIYRRSAYVPPANAWVNWTAAGPSRDVLTSRFNRNWRPIVGGGQRSMWGQHTNIEMEKNALKGKPRMKPAQQNKLTVQRYRGQSYSATTKVVK